MLSQGHQRSEMAANVQLVCSYLILSPLYTSFALMHLNHLRSCHLRVLPRGEIVLTGLQISSLTLKRILGSAFSTRSHSTMLTISLSGF